MHEIKTKVDKKEKLQQQSDKQKKQKFMIPSNTTKLRKSKSLP